MSKADWRMYGIGGGFVIVCVATSLVVGKLFDSRDVAAYSFGALLLAGYWGIMLSRIGPVNSESRFHPLVHMGVSLTILGATLGLAGHRPWNLVVLLSGLAPFIAGRKRSDLPPIRW